MRGYLDNPEATSATLDGGGWLHTGDIVTIDSDGWFRVTDRIKGIIKYKGYQVAPAELEEILLAHPAVADCAVVRSPDKTAGEVPKAFVVLKAPASAAELTAWVADRVTRTSGCAALNSPTGSSGPRRARSCAGCWPSASGPHVRRI
jgi:acyl-CoA synthetase (AMP-forming)/AMP-acid ligase II